MASEDRDQELLKEAGFQQGVEPEILTQLLSLAEEYSAITVYGSKVDFSRRVAEILDKAASAGSGS